MHNQRPRDQILNLRARTDIGRADLIVIGIVGILIALGFVAIMFTMVRQSEEHVKKVKKTKVSYQDALAWRPDSSECETQIQQDLEDDPKRVKASYKRLDLSDEALRKIGKMSKLKKLTLEESMVKDEWLRHLSRLPLKDLSLCGTTITDNASRHIKHIEKLEELDLSSTNVSSAVLHDLAELPQLRELKLNQTQVDDEGIEELKKFKSLEHLELKHTKATRDCLKNIVKIPTLNTLRLQGPQFIKGDISHLSELKHLEDLNLSDCGVDDELLPEIENLNGLRSLDLSRAQISSDAICKLNGLEHLEHLTVKNCPDVEEEELAKFKKQFPGCKVTAGNHYVSRDNRNMGKFKSQFRDIMIDLPAKGNRQVQNAEPASR